MKKIILLFFLVSSVNLIAATGWFDDFITIQGTLFYIGSNPGSGVSLDGHVFGSVLQLQITSADMKYWSDTQDRTGGAFYYKIMSSDGLTEIVAPTEVIWTHSALGGNNYQGIWSGTVDLLNGLSGSTTYKLHIWAKSWGSQQGDSWLSNGGANYVATFTTDAAVPVELTSFVALTSAKTVDLKWQTSTEINNNRFEIERSQKSETWVKIGFVAGSGNSNSTKNYSYTDNTVKNGKYSYRLKQIDNDGAYKYSDVVEVEVNNTPSVYSLEQNYPNPFNPSTTIKFSLPEAVNVSLKVFNVLGQEIKTLVSGIKPAGEHSITFNAKELNSGLYFYKLEAGSFNSVRKMLLTK